MNKARYILGSFSLINIILAGSVFFLVNYMLLPSPHRDVRYTLPIRPEQERPDSGGKNSQDKQKPLSPMDFAVVTEKNLFHPERKIPVEKVAAQPLPKPEFVLYGTLISKDASIAYMEDRKAPYSTPGRGKRQKRLYKGQRLNGFMLSEVFTDRVVMVRGEDRIEVMVTGGKSKSRASSPTVGKRPSDVPGQVGAPKNFTGSNGPVR